VIYVSLGAALEAADGDIARLSREVSAGLVARLKAGEWDPAAIALAARCEAGWIFVTVRDGAREFTARVELQAFCGASTAVH